jgi:hypothetical protein
MLWWAARHAGSGNSTPSCDDDLTTDLYVEQIDGCIVTGSTNERCGGVG